MTDDLLKVLIQVTGRMVIPAERLRQLVAPRAGGAKQLDAYNLCDGTRTQADIVKKLGLDKGNFSRAVDRWELLGVVFRIGPKENLLHVYPVGED